MSFVASAQRQQTFNKAAGAAPFEVGVRSQCSRTHSLRGRRSQCARAASRTSSTRFGSSESSRSSTRNQRPASNVELRGEAQSIAPPLVNLCATGFVRSVLDNAMDDIAMVDEATITNEFEGLDEETTVLQDSVAKQLYPCMSDSEESEAGEDCSACDFNDDVCSIASNEVDEGIANTCAKTAVSDDVIREALALEDLAEDQEDDSNNGNVEFLGEGLCCGDALAFDFASDILGGAFAQAATTWTAPADVKESAVQNGLSALEVLKEKAKLMLLKAAKENALVACTDVAVQKWTDTHMESLKQKARDCLLKAARPGLAVAPTKPEVASKNEQSKAEKAVQLKVRQALCKGLHRGGLAGAFGGALQQDKFVALRSKVQQNLAKSAASGQLQCTFRQAIQKTDIPAEPKKSDNDEAVVCKVRQALSKGLHAGQLSKKFGVALQNDKWVDLRSKVKQSFATATASGKLAGVLRQIVQKETHIKTKQANHEHAAMFKVRQALSKGLHSGHLSNTFAAALEKDAWAALQNKIKNSLKQSCADGMLGNTLQAMLVTSPPFVAAQPLAPTRSGEVASGSRARTLHSSRSKRRVIGAVVRSPAAQQDDPPATPSTTLRKQSRKAAKEAAAAIRMDLGSPCEDHYTPARDSSLTRSYDTLGVQFFSLAKVDDAPRASSRTRARLHAATASAMAMDLEEGPRSVSSPSAVSMRSPGRIASPAFHQSCAPMPLKLNQKMRGSASMGSLSSINVKKQAPGGLLPILAAEKQSAESIAWTMQVSKTTSMWSNTALRRSASMIF